MASRRAGHWRHSRPSPRVPWSRSPRVLWWSSQRQGMWCLWLHLIHYIWLKLQLPINPIYCAQLLVPILNKNIVGQISPFSPLLPQQQLFIFPLVIFDLWLPKTLKSWKSLNPLYNQYLLKPCLSDVLGHLCFLHCFLTVTEYKGDKDFCWQLAFRLDSVISSILCLQLSWLPPHVILTAPALRRSPPPREQWTWLGLKELRTNSFPQLLGLWPVEIDACLLV